MIDDYYNDVLEVVWFESMGAKSSCIAVNTGDGYLLIDPGAAVMHPSFPLSLEEKVLLRRRAVERIVEVSARASTIIITHYHYDHHILPGDPELGGVNIYSGKRIYVKDPNRYINYSQWGRARLFLEELLKIHGLNLEEYRVKPRQKRFRDPLEELKLIHERDYGDYAERRRELLEKGRRWFRKLAELWRNNEWVREPVRLPDNTEIFFGDGRRITVGRAHVEIYKPWFHGVEYDKTGWVTPVFIEVDGLKVFYTSDLMGPIIEDYAYHIADKDPDIVVLDGPPTYLYPYMFNRVNLERALDNAETIIDAEPRLIIYDHHLLRDPRWRKRVKRVLEYAVKRKVKLLTAAEVLGDTPVADRVARRS